MTHNFLLPHPYTPAPLHYLAPLLDQAAWATPLHPYTPAPLHPPGSPAGPGSVGFTRRAGATRLTHASMADLLTHFPDAVPAMSHAQQTEPGSSHATQENEQGRAGEGTGAGPGVG